MSFAVTAVSVVGLCVLATAEASSQLNDAPAGRSSWQAGAVGNVQRSGGASQTLTGFKP